MVQTFLTFIASIILVAFSLYTLVLIIALLVGALPAMVDPGNWPMAFQITHPVLAVILGSAFARAMQYTQHLTRTRAL